MGDAVKSVMNLFAAVEQCGDWADEQKLRFKEQFCDELLRLAEAYEDELEAARQAVNDSN